MKLPQFPGLDDIVTWWTPKSEFAFAGAASGRPRTSSASTPKGGSLLFSSGSGSGGSDDGGYDDDDYYEEEPPQQTRRPAGAQRRQAPAPAPGQGGGSESGGGRQRTVQYQPEERYWTEYLRIALPILGLLLMIALLWFWALQLTGNDNNGNDSLQTPVGTTEVITPPTTEATEEVVVPPTDEPSTPVVTEETPVVEDETPVEPPPTDDIAIGATVSIIDDGVNMRSEATTDSDVVIQLNTGDILEVTDGPIEGDNYVWWQVVTEDGEVGYVAEDFIEVAP